MTVEFGTQGETCRKIIQDISIYYEKCQSYCGSNDCPDVEPYYKHPTLNKCVSLCPPGYTESANDCIPTAFCHSSCGTCSTKNDASQCLTCLSYITSLSYEPFAGVNSSESCFMPNTSNAQQLLTINKDTIIGTSLLKSITYNSLTQSLSGTSLNSLIYTQNVI